VTGPTTDAGASPEPGASAARRNIVWSHSLVSADQRAAVLGHRPATVWLTGLSGSGKSTIATHAERALVDAGIAAYVLDGDNIRHGLNGDLGFSPEDRTENIRRIGEVCRLFCDAGLVVLTAFISPYRADRDLVRTLHEPGSFHEVHVDTPLEVCEARDPKGLYRRARAGEIPEFSGISAPYEPPPSPELVLPTGGADVDDCVRRLLDHLEAAGISGTGGSSTSR
jgi:adenylyl-sulfate kinase